MDGTTLLPNESTELAFAKMRLKQLQAAKAGPEQIAPAIKEYRRALRERKKMDQEEEQ